MSIAKPRRDEVVLVTCVGSILAESAGRTLLRHYEQQLSQTMVDVRCEVLVSRQPAGGQAGVAADGGLGGLDGRRRVVEPRSGSVGE